MQMERVNFITEKFERVLNTTLAPDYAMDGKLKQALSDIDDIGTLSKLKLKELLLFIAE